ncbi:MAG TPA: carboxylesterase family protein [Burkholderiaceae bacterium]|jgi:para-nitrobenzyl esterase
MKDELTVATRSGQVRGCLLDEARVRVWRGIPFAAPPTGPLRWRPPVQPEPWQGVRDATRFAADPVQAPMPVSQAAGSGEDCLALNVWAPCDDAEALRPVMVWVHGGGFVGGTGADARCDGARLASRGVVAVSFNYRTGLFGFLAHPALSAESPRSVSGNYGLLDQLQALGWVRDNIAAFGGDPSRVTVFGVSAGSASISLLLTSPLAAGAFSQAVLHSPGAARPLASLADAETAGLRLGSDLQALRAMSAPEVFALTPLLAPKVRGLTTPRVLRPIRDGWLLPEDERDAFLAGRIHPMPMIVGTNADEGSMLTAAWPVDTLEGYRRIVESNFASAVPSALSQYPAGSPSEARARVAEMFADTQFNYGARLLAQASSRQRRGTWRYLFDRRRPGQSDGPHHGDEVGYVFGNLERDRTGRVARHDAVDARVSAAMSEAWVAFARGGDPNMPGRTAWPAHTGDADEVLRFGETIGMEPDRRRAQLDFLEAFYSRS